MCHAFQLRVFRRMLQRLLGLSSSLFRQLKVRRKVYSLFFTCNAHLWKHCMRLLVNFQILVLNKLKRRSFFPFHLNSLGIFAKFIISYLEFQNARNLHQRIKTKIFYESDNPNGLMLDKKVNVQVHKFQNQPI